MILEDFAIAPPPPPGPEIDRAAVFDQGYQAGWKDAATAIKDEDLRLGASLAERLNGFAHDQQTAATLCLAQVEGLLTELFDKILPRAADRAFLSVILEEAERLLQINGENSLTVRVSPEALSPLRDILDEAKVDLQQIAIEPEIGLDPLQARVTHPDGEREINLSRVLDAMDEAFDAIRHQDGSK